MSSISASSRRYQRRHTFNHHYTQCQQVPRQCIIYPSRQRHDDADDLTAVAQQTAGDGWAFWCEVYDRPSLRKQLDDKSRIRYGEQVPCIRQIMHEASTGKYDNVLCIYPLYYNSNRTSNEQVEQREMHIEQCMQQALGDVIRRVELQLVYTEQLGCHAYAAIHFRSSSFARQYQQRDRELLTAVCHRFGIFEATSSKVVGKKTSKLPVKMWPEKVFRKTILKDLEPYFLHSNNNEAQSSSGQSNQSLSQVDFANIVSVEWCSTIIDDNEQKWHPIDSIETKPQSNDISVQAICDETSSWLAKKQQQRNDISSINLNQSLNQMQQASRENEEAAKSKQLNTALDETLINIADDDRIRLDVCNYLRAHCDRFEHIIKTLNDNY